ncbi:MAG: hypothetical protein SGJ17_12655 [Hyphomicrobiales bacterium]|nr:hypothetical protein [Hyphomicrobiales bacterium]
MALVILFGWQTVNSEPVKPAQSDVYYDVVTSGGEPKVCSIKFSMVYQDFIYKNGGLVGVTGSVSWLGNESYVGVMLKVFAVDIANYQPLTTKSVRIGSANITAGSENYKPLMNLQCEDPAASCSVYKTDTSLLFLEVLENKSLFVNYNRHASGIDIKLPIVPRSNISEESNFHKCLEHIVKAIN